MRSAIARLKDAQISSLSFASRFDLAYNAAHGIALTLHWPHRGQALLPQLIAVVHESQAH